MDDLTARREDHKAERVYEPLTREGAMDLYARLDDAGLNCRLAKTAGVPLLGGKRADVRNVVEVEVESIKNTDHLRLIAEIADRLRIPVQGSSYHVQLG